MPQLEQIDTYTAQLIWMVIVFTGLYLIMVKIALPRIGAALEGRQARLDADLERASALKEEADGVLAAYERALAVAHGEGQETLRQVAQEISALAAQRQGEVSERLSSDLWAAEGRIAAAKAGAMESVRMVAGEAAAAATERLIGTAPKAERIIEAVDAAMSDVQD
jgi:F-type H+-transporting ATPase subunit b